MTNSHSSDSRTGQFWGPINTVIAIGLGEVFRQRYSPALAQLLNEGLLHRLFLLDIHADCPLDLAGFPIPAGGVHYLQVIDNILPLEELQLGPHALVLLCTPTRFHACHAKQCLGTGCRVGLEKPLTHSLAWAHSLLPFAHTLYIIDHFLFKTDMLKHLQVVGARVA